MGPPCWGGKCEAACRVPAEDTVNYEFRFWAENDRFMNWPAGIKLQKIKDFDG